MIYELWEHDGGHTFVGRDENEDSYRIRLARALEGECNVRLTWSVEADSYDEAMQLLYDQKGYGTYNPIDDEDSDAVPTTVNEPPSPQSF